MKIGVISDTHGFIHPKVFSIFDGVEQILHAGDIGSEDIVTSLETLAPVQAVYGNIDSFPLTSRYPEILTLELAEFTVCILHQYFGMDHPLIQNAVKNTPKKKIDLLIYGHTHQAQLERQGDLLLFNPGAAGRQRFSLRPAVGLLTLDIRGAMLPEIIYLDAK
ncbi:MAG: metallophosphoesterase family protein [bacterium]